MHHYVGRASSAKYKATVRRPSVSAGGRVEVAEEGDDDDAGGGDAEHG